MFFSIVTIATFMYFKLKSDRNNEKRRLIHILKDYQTDKVRTSEFRLLQLEMRKKKDGIQSHLIYHDIWFNARGDKLVIMYMQCEAGNTCTFQLQASR